MNTAFFGVLIGLFNIFKNKISIGIFLRFCKIPFSNISLYR